jgi:CRP-like cAMP-binding protein
VDKVPRKCISVNRSELFAGVPGFVSKQVISSARPKEFLYGDVMYCMGDPIKQVLLLTDGCVKKSQFSEHGNEVITRLTIPGEVVYEPALVPGGTYTSTAQALQNCRVLAWESAIFEAALDCFPELRRNANRILDRRLAELERRYYELSTKTASPRIANCLVHLLDKIGNRVNSHIEVNVTQEALSQMTAMTLFEVCRQLTIWKRTGVVKLRREIIEIHSVPRLLDLCRVK